MTGQVDRESPERKARPDRENLLREPEVLDHPEAVSEQDLVGAGVLGIPTAADRIMVDADGACLVVDKPLSTLRREERGMVMPLFGGLTAFTPTGSQEDDPIREVPRETRSQELRADRKVGSRVAEISKDRLPHEGSESCLLYTSPSPRD